ncbi:MAG: sugar ABC transporter permease [Anaerolineae bacterium]|nr:sugar ABC transporter permease [Anaerolineae bacterium]MBN8617428.1 sugar ABC transporter permease [Anaerolineae bacterium]
MESISGLTADTIGATLSQVIPLLIGVSIGIVVLEVSLYYFLTRVIKTKHALAYTLLSPAVVALVLFLIYPLIFNVILAFSDLKRNTFVCYSPVARGRECELDHLYGLDYAINNFTQVFFRVRDGEIQRDADGNLVWGRLLRTADSTFPVLFGRTVVWTGVNVIFHFLGGLALALIMNQKIRFRGIYRSLIVIPWAIPTVIVGLTWRQEFHADYGFVNQVLTSLGMTKVNWLSEELPAFIAVIFVNVWLGIPFYMVMLLGGLQSIPAEYYEASQMDGANAWQRFKAITIPLLRPILIPAITLDVIWTFNQLNVVYLVTRGGPSEKTNILVSALYNAAFGESATQELGFAAAFSIVIFLILFVFAVVWITTSGGLKEVYDR